MEDQAPSKEIDLNEVVVTAKKPKESGGFWDSIGSFFGNLFSKKTDTTTNTPKQDNNMAAAALIPAISETVGGIFNFLAKGKEVKIAEEKTEQLKLQLQATEDIELHTLFSEENTTVMADKTQMDQILFKRFDARLATFLIEESAIEDSDSLEITHEKIANHMGTAREVVTRMLKYFQEENMVSLARGGVTLLNRAKLIEMAG